MNPRTAPLCCLLAFALAGSGALTAAGPGDVQAPRDGTTDATAAIQQAVDRAPGRLHFAKGVYRLTSPVTIDLARTGPVSISAAGATLVMAGPGPALDIVGTHAGSADPNSVKDGVWQNERTPLVDGLVVQGDHPEALGIRIQGAMQPTVTRVMIRRCLHGLVLTGRNRNVIVSECHFYHNTGAGLLMERLNLHQVNVTNCHISYNVEGGIVVRQSEIRNLHIGTCDLEANMAAEAPPSANILIDCREGSVREGAIIGCTLQHSKLPVGAANIRFLGQSPEQPQKVGFFSIGDNQISDCGVNVHLQHARGVNVTGNTFFGGHQHNLLVENSSQIVVGPNLFDRNPDYRQTSPDGLEFVDCSDCTLTGLHLYAVQQADAALILRRCRWINLTSSMFLDCDTCAVLLDDCRHCRLSDCVTRAKPDADPPPVSLRTRGGRDNRLGDNAFDTRADIAPDSLTEAK